jgi:septum formation protein
VTEAQVDLRPAYPADFRLLLASQSPRRHSLLRDLGVPYEVVATTAEEVLTGDTAVALAAANAMAKVQHPVLPDAAPGAFILGTDTLVTLGDRVMGKPRSRVEAAAMIAELAGRTHQVVSGVALRRIAGVPGGPTDGLKEQVHVATAATDVTFLPLDAPQIDAYLASGEWSDKAGAYGVQGLAATFVFEIRGEYSNVVGLPLCLLARMFSEAGFDLLRRQWL